jgi:uncharacterized phiE125 gp8 family phage protein
MDDSTFQIVTPAAAYMTAADFKDQLRILDDDLQTSLVNDYIAAASEYIRERTGHVFKTTVYLFCFDRWPYNRGAGWFGPSNSEVVFPRNPVASVDSVQYVDTDGTLQTLAPSEYQTDLVRRPARIIPKRFGFWPTLDVVTPNAVRITFTAGYSNEALIPLRYKQAMRFLVAHWHQNRVPVDDVGSEIPKGLESLINNLKIGDVP